jgi:hypothetical protein
MALEMMAMEQETFDGTLKRAKQTAVEAALAAGKLIRKQFDEVIVPEWKSDDGDIVTATDRASEAVIRARIGSAFQSMQAWRRGFSRQTVYRDEPGAVYRGRTSG